MSLAIGDPAPGLELPDTAGETHAPPGPRRGARERRRVDLQPLPYALAWHERIQAVAREYAERAVVFLQVNSNDAERYPPTRAEAMRKRVEAGEFASLSA